MIRALIFDYFGVVRPLGHGLRSIYASFGGDVAKDEMFLADVTTAAMYGFIDDVDEQIAAKLGITVEEWRAAVADTSRHHDQTLLEYILLLRQKGYKVGLLSNAGPGALEEYFGGSQVLQKYFDVALASGDIDLVKPEAAAYRLMAEKLGLPPEECIMIDDRSEYCQGAERVGMQAVLYATFDEAKPRIEQLLSANPKN